MRIRNRTRDTLLGTKVAQAATWWSRLRGFIGRAEPSQGEGILLVRCAAIHTLWMRFKLDVIFLDERGKVLEMIRALPPWRLSRKVRGAHYVLEVPVGTIESSGTELGDELTWRTPPPYTLRLLSPEGNEGSLSNLNRRSEI